MLSATRKRRLVLEIFRLLRVHQISDHEGISVLEHGESFATTAADCPRGLIEVAGRPFENRGDFGVAALN
jgi:hypothetical protein